MSDIPKDAREVYLGPDGKPIAYCPKEGLGVTDLQRGFFFAEQRVRLEQLKARARVRTAETGVELVVVAIDVDDPTWKVLVETLMPKYDWAAYRARGETPVARGLVQRPAIAELVAKAYPAAGELGPGHPIVVFAAGGIAIIQDSEGGRDASR